jgi:hypothetical protein
MIKEAIARLVLHDIGPKSFQRFSKTASFARTSKKMGFWTEAHSFSNFWTETN